MKVSEVFNLERLNRGMSLKKASAASGIPYTTLRCVVTYGRDPSEVTEHKMKQFIGSSK